MKNRQLIIQVVLFLLVFLFFAIFRFYNLDKRIVFDWDQEQLSNQIKDILINHKLTLLGPRLTDTEGFYLGPFFTYLLLPFYLISNLHPSALYYFVIFLSLIFFITTFFVFKKLKSIFFALSFLFFWSINPILAIYDITPWWPITIPLGVIATWFVLYRIYNNNNLYDWIVLGLLLGFFLNMHFQFILIIVFLVFFLILNIKKNNFIKLKKIFLLFFSFFLTFIPLIIFDIRHNFINLKLFVNFFLLKKIDAVKDINVWKQVFANFIEPFTGISQIPLAYIFYAIILFLMLYQVFNTKNRFFQKFYISTVFLWLLFPIIFAIYGKRPSEYYFVLFVPYIYFVICDYIFSVNKLIFLIIAAFLLNINLNKLSANLDINLYGMYYKDLIIKEIGKEVGNKKINIFYNVPIGASNGYQYFIDYYQLKNSKNPKDPSIEIDIPARDSNIQAGGIGAKIPKELKSQ